jgi:hypothetical protein
VTTLAPLPGRDTEPDGDGAASSLDHEVATVTDTPTIITGPAARDTVDLTRAGVRPAPGTTASQASWVFGLALSLLSEGTAERVVMAEVVAEAAGRSQALEGAYGRAVALLSEYPGDPLVQSTVDLLAKALLRSRRPARTAEEA